MAKNNKDQNAAVVEKIVPKSVVEILSSSMMTYSEYVILDRAIPRLEDGLKPVQRRILYSMYELGLTPDKDFKKCARIVGECLGKYHPHGDSSVYGALVNLAQDFKTNMTLVNGHGNFGSVDGDTAAAMRYTEAKLTDISMELLRDIEKDTVTWSYNFDDSLKEPNILPSRYPNILVNGATGIGVAIATKIPSHNLGEVIDACIATIDNPAITVDEMMEYIKGPDFPTGATIIVDDKLRDVFTEGTGAVTMMAKYHIESTKNRNMMVITELPYETNKSVMLETIANLRPEKREDVSKSIFAAITDVRDESDRDGMRAVVEFRKDVNAEKLISHLIKKAKGLMSRFNYNMYVIADGKPKLLGIMDIIKKYIEYQRTVIVKRTQYDLEKAEERKHILEGLVIAINNIHEVIEIIKSSKSTEEARTNLEKTFKLSERQARAILDMRLSRLSKLEVNKLIEEIEDLTKKIAEYKLILSSTKKQFNLIKTEMLAIKKKYKTPRLTEVVHETNGKVQEIKEKLKEEKEYREGYLILNHDSYLKALSINDFESANKKANFLEISQLIKDQIKVNSNEDIYAFTNKGNVLIISLHDLSEDKWRNRGTNVNQLFKSLLKGEEVIRIFTESQLKDKQLYFISRDGYVKLGEFNDLDSDKKYYPATQLKSDNDEIINVEIKMNSDNIFFVTNCGNCLNMKSDKIPCQGKKASGVRCIKLADNDFVVKAMQVGEEGEQVGEIVIVTKDGYAKRVILETIKSMDRDRMGFSIQKLNDKDRVILAEHVMESFDIVMKVSDFDNKLVINTEDIPIKSIAQQNKLTQLTKLSKIDMAVKHNYIDEE